jgi:hypothetical protein
MNAFAEDLYLRSTYDVTTEELIGATHIALLSSGSPSAPVSRVSSKPPIQESRAVTRRRDKKNRTTMVFGDPSNAVNDPLRAFLEYGAKRESGGASRDPE